MERRPRRSFSHAWVILLVAAAPMTVGVTARAGLPQDAALIERGIEVYANERCGLCHAIADKGNKKGPLDDVGSRLTAEEIELWMVDPKGMTEKTGATRKPLMKAYPDLSREDLDALVAYMLSLTGE